MESLVGAIVVESRRLEKDFACCDSFARGHCWCESGGTRNEFKKARTPALLITHQSQTLSSRNALKVTNHGIKSCPAVCPELRTGSACSLTGQADLKPSQPLALTSN